MSETLLYTPIHWWPRAYHVYCDDRRIGIVNRKTVRMVRNGQLEEYDRWFAHNHHFFDIDGQFATRTEAAQAIPRGKIRQPVDAWSKKSPANGPQTANI